MNLIKSIEINKIKGINNKKIELDLIPNKASIFVAPNGFGKSSITVSFDALKSNKIELSKDNYYNGKENNDLFLKIIETIDKDNYTYEADLNKNEISKVFDVFVINHKVEADAKLMAFNGRSLAKSDLVIRDMILVNSIPEKIAYNYSWSNSSKKYGANSKISPNLETFLKKRNNIFLIYSNRKYFDNILNGSRINDKINIFIANISNLSGTKKEIFSNIDLDLVCKILEESNVAYLTEVFIEELSKLSVQEKILCIIEIIEFYKNNKPNIKKIYERNFYEIYKERIKGVFSSFNNRSQIVSIVEERKKLVVKFPKAKMLSNGEIDIFTFIILLEQAKQKLNKDKCILIIDEIFDYLDDVNLVAAQYYVSKFINSFKKSQKQIYPIIMTHLDPNLFKNYYFSDMKVYYLKEDNVAIDNDLKKIIIEREKFSNDVISRCYVHFCDSSDDTSVDITSDCKQIGITINYNTPPKFRQMIYEELEKYCNDKKCDYLMAICGIRVRIEEFLYNKITDKNDKEKFLSTDYTIKKIEFCESIGVEIPESFRFLSIIYNDMMHLDSKADPQNKKIKYLSSKLDNLIIKQLIANSLAYIKKIEGSNMK